MQKENLSKKEIEDLLPHREPMLLIDELYDIKKDKLEKKNLAKNEKYKNIRQELLKKISNWMKSTKDPLLSNQIKSPFFIDTLKELK